MKTLWKLLRKIKVITGEQEKFCKECKHLSITELEQDKFYHQDKPEHWCKKYKKRVLHGHAHPELLRFYECLHPVKSKILSILGY